jgi:23S rRNA (adenine2503-C2)-methyltransferase
MLSTDFEQMRQFQLYLTERSIAAPVRYSRGQDVSAACGQLASKRKDELHLTPRTVALERRKEYLALKKKYQT